ELDLVVKLNFCFHNWWRRWLFGRRRLSRCSYADAVDELALERSLASFKDNLDPWPVVRFVTFCDESDGVELHGADDQEFGVFLLEVSNQFFVFVGAFADQLHVDEVDRKQKWTFTHVLSVVVR